MEKRIIYPKSPDEGWGRLLWIYYMNYGSFWKLTLGTKLIHRYLEFGTFSQLTEPKYQLVMDNPRIWWLKIKKFQITCGIWGMPKWRKLTI